MYYQFYLHCDITEIKSVFDIYEKIKVIIPSVFIYKISLSKRQALINVINLLHSSLHNSITVNLLSNKHIL